MTSKHTDHRYMEKGRSDGLIHRRTPYSVDVSFPDSPCGRDLETLYFVDNASARAFAAQLKLPNCNMIVMKSPAAIRGETGFVPATPEALASDRLKLSRPAVAPHHTVLVSTTPPVLVWVGSLSLCALLISLYASNNGWLLVSVVVFAYTLFDAFRRREINEEAEAKFRSERQHHDEATRQYDCALRAQLGKQSLGPDQLLNINMSRLGEWRNNLPVVEPIVETRLSQINISLPSIESRRTFPSSEFITASEWALLAELQKTLIVWQQVQVKREDPQWGDDEDPFELPNGFTFLCVDLFTVNPFTGEFWVIEVDGDRHRDPDLGYYDQIRDAWMVSRGVNVIRVPNHVINESLPIVTERICSIVLGGEAVPSGGTGRLAYDDWFKRLYGQGQNGQGTLAIGASAVGSFSPIHSGNPTIPGADQVSEDSREALARDLAVPECTTCSNASPNTRSAPTSARSNCPTCGKTRASEHLEALVSVIPVGDPPPETMKVCCPNCNASNAVASGLPPSHEMCWSCGASIKVSHQSASPQTNVHQANDGAPQAGQQPFAGENHGLVVSCPGCGRKNRVRDLKSMAAAICQLCRARLFEASTKVAARPPDDTRNANILSPSEQLAFDVDEYASVEGGWGELLDDRQAGRALPAWGETYWSADDEWSDVWQQSAGCDPSCIAYLRGSYFPLPEQIQQFDILKEWTIEELESYKNAPKEPSQISNDSEAGRDLTEMDSSWFPNDYVYAEYYQGR